ncbi:hypothetical protein EJ03DRAFT_57433 [Teratosphaeria nubilosa]|uniref:Uncharacterized protein n=1 Tax=Teratosphaeria nubilosa TaxID=161662 RepID=A0A6G1KTM9_9PEZI|nr:hypothetical protein EJ03DRAFT_57433 [Teratosphaeria nubilosa]
MQRPDRAPISVHRSHQSFPLMPPLRLPDFSWHQPSLTSHQSPHGTSSHPLWSSLYLPQAETVDASYSMPSATPLVLADMHLHLNHHLSFSSPRTAVLRSRREIAAVEERICRVVVVMVAVSVAVAVAVVLGVCCCSHSQEMIYISCQGRGIVGGMDKIASLLLQIDMAGR